MARVTVEDCLARIPNRFALTILGSRRARALGEGRGRALVECDNKEGVTALREIANDQVRFKEDVGAALVDYIEEQRRQLRVTAGEHTFLEAASLRALEDDDVEEEDDTSDVEELQADPEAITKVVKATGDGDDDTASDDEEEEVFEDDATFSDDDALPDDAADADAPEIDDDAATDDEEAESTDDD